MNLPEIFPPTNAVQWISRYFVDIGVEGRWIYYSAEASLFYFIIFLVVFSFVKNQQTAIEPYNSERSLLSKLLLSDWLFILFVVSFILLCRIPLAILGIQNPDEPLWIASAKTFYHDPRPWVSADTGTGGPIVPMLLISLKWFGLPIDHGSLKFMSGGIMALSASAVYFGFVKMMSRPLSRLVILPLVVAVSVMVNNDMIAYNSEHSVILLLAFSFLFLARVNVVGTGKFQVNTILLGILLGLVPFAKLQGAPIAFFFGLTACLIVYKKGSMKPLFTLMASALFPSILFLPLIFFYGGFGEFWFSYVQNNLIYAAQTSTEGDGIARSMNLFFGMLSVPKELHFFFYYSLTVIVFGFTLLLSFMNRMKREQIAKLLFVVGMLLITIYCIVAPGRGFIHYILLLFIPITIASAIIIHIAVQVIQDFQKDLTYNSDFFSFSFAVVFLLISCFYYFQSNFTYTPDYLNKANERYVGFSLHHAVVGVLNRYYDTNERMAIWGWGPELFESTDFLMGTRDCASSFQIEEGPNQQRLLKRYIDDLKKNKPKLFVEAMGTNFFGFQDRTKSVFENFPNLNDYIKSNYTFVGDIGGARIFVQNGKLQKKKAWISNDKFQPTTQEFHSSVDEYEVNGTFLQIKGWTVLGDNTDKQKVKLALISKADTILVETYQLANKSVVDFAPQNKGYLMCGFLSFLPLPEIPPGDFELGLLVQNENQVGFKWLGKTINRDSLINKHQP
jgi:hypothetical protein